MTTSYRSTEDIASRHRTQTDPAFKLGLRGADVTVMDATIDSNANRPVRRDRGNTFNEVLIAVALMGFAFTAVITGMRTVIAASSRSDDAAKVEAALNSASDRLAAWSYTPCPGPNGEDYLPVVQAAVGNVGWAARPDLISITNVRYWNSSRKADGSTSVNDADGSWASANSPSGVCNEDIGLTTSRTLQMITIQVTSPSGEVVRSLDVVKSNVVADPTSTSTTTTTTIP
jgi:type II secretory pathway pseudopilin PulG